MTGHGGWPMTVRARPRRQPVLRRHLLPGPAAARAAGVPAGAGGARRRVARTAADDVRRVAGRPARAPAAGRPPPRRAPIDARRARRAPCTLLAREFDARARRLRRRAEVPAVDGAGVPAAARASRPAPRRRWLDATCEAMARGGIYDQLGGGFARYAVDRGWVVPHFEKMLYDNALLLAVYARWGDAAGRRGWPRETADFLLARAAAPPRAASPPRSTPTPRASRARSTPGRRPSWSRCSARTTARGRPQLLEVTDAGTFEHGASTLQLLRGPRRPRAAGPTCAARLLEPRARRGSGRPATTRSSPPGTGWRSAGSCDAGRLLGEPDVRRRRGRGRRAAGRRCTSSTAGCCGSPATASPGRTPGCWRTTAASPPASSPCSRRPATPSGSTARGSLLDVALDHFRADDGGFYDTADDAEALVARPRDPSDNASPSGLSAMVHALVDVRRAHRRRAATARPPRRRSRTVAALAERAPRFAGWSLAAAEAMLDGPARDRGRRPARRRRATRSSAAARRRARARSSWSPTAPRDDIPLLAGRDRGRRPRRRRTSAASWSASARSPTRELRRCGSPAESVPSATVPR